jgi:hypothetical protein
MSQVQVATKVAKSIKANLSAPFWVEVMSEDPALISVNGTPCAVWKWNLLLIRRDVGLYSKGILPHRGWKVTTVKRHLGVTGSADVLREKVNAIYDGLVSADRQRFEPTKSAHVA